MRPSQNDFLVYLKPRNNTQISLISQSLQFIQYSMSQYELTRELNRIIKLSSIDFQRQMSLLCFNPHIFSVLASFLMEERGYSQKQLAAVGINYAVTRRIRERREETMEIWEEIVKYVLLQKKVQGLQWSILCVLGKSIEILMQEFQKNICGIINPLLKVVTIKPKILLYLSFLYIQSQQTTKIIFVRQTIQLFLSESLNFICAYHDSHKQDKQSDKMQRKIIEILVHLLKALRAPNQDFQKLINDISLNTDIFLIIVEILLFDPLNHAYESLNKRDFSPERMGQLCLFSEIQGINFTKSCAFKVFTTILKQYVQTAGIEQFDYHKCLLFMQNLTPLTIDKLAHISKDKKLCEQNEQLIYQMLYFLSRGCQFNFMLVIFQNSLEKIFYQILVPLIQTSDQEFELFQETPEEFILIAENLVELNEFFSDTLKNATGVLVETFARYINGSLTFMVDMSIQTIRSIVLAEKSMKVEEAVASYGFRPSIDTSFVLLTQFSSHYLCRKQFFEILRTRLLNLQELFGLNHFDKGRLLIFIAYNYEMMFESCPGEGHKYLILANQALSGEFSLPQCGLMVFENCLKLGFGDDIWCALISNIETARGKCVFSLIRKIIDQMLEKLLLEKVVGLIQKVIERLIRQFGVSSAQSKGGSIHGSEELYSCLNIVSSIAGNRKYLKQQKQVINAIWPILDLLQFSQSIEFQDNILIIYNNLLTADYTIGKPYFRFIPHFHKIYNKYNGFVHLLTTVTLLLIKGRDYFLTTQDGRQDLENLLIFIKQTYGVMKNQETLKHILVFYHYAYLQYATVISLDVSLYNKLLQIYDDQKKVLKGETIASIINFVLVSQFKFGNCDLTIIKENRIEIFKGYQAKIFSLNLRNIIDKSTDNATILQYLRYSIRLIHYITEVNLSHNPQSHNYYRPDFPELSSIDPFQQICLSLNSIKRSMQPCRYDAILQQLSSEISLGEIKDLLSKRIVDKSLRTIKRVKHQQ